MNTFQEFYEDKKAEAAFQEVLLEFFPGAGLLAGIFLDIAKEMLQKVLIGIASVASVFFGAKLLGRAINYILKKNRERLEKANDEMDFEKNYEKEIKLAEIQEKADELSDEEIKDLEDKVSKHLAEKYPSKEQGWWLSVLDNTASFMKTTKGALLPTIAFILLI